MKNTKKIFMICLSLIVTMVAVACSGFNQSALKKKLEARDIAGVVSFYLDKCSNEADQQKFIKYLVQYEKDAYDNYNNQKIIFEQADEIYRLVEQVAEQLNLTYNFDTHRKDLEKLKASKKSFDSAMETYSKLMKQSDLGVDSSNNSMILSIMKNCNRVIKEDTNYGKAESIKKEVSGYYRSKGEWVR